ETLPATIETLEAAVRVLHASMADPAFFRQEKGMIAEANARLATLENQLAEAYDRWESLEASGV
ncbi:MAG: ABC transporter ATP-binding protein, partial [Planctomycetota bacterium]|nr:ABC transporter ATP-binding protein [Planctomycetota bacterium]